MATDFDIERVSALYKEVYPKPVQDQLNNATPLLAVIERTTEDIEIGEGDQIAARVPILIRRNPGVGARKFMDPAPKGSTSGYGSIFVNLKYMYARILVPHQYMLVKGKEAAITSFMKSETDSTIATAKTDLERQAHGDGSGLLATSMESAPAQTVIDVDDTRHFFEGRRVDLYDKISGLAVAGGLDREVVSVDPDNSRITLDAAVNVISSTGFFNQGARNAEFTGLDALNSATNPALGPYQKLDATTQRLWRANMTNGAAAPFSGAYSEALFQAHQDKIEQASGRSGDSYLILTTYAGRAAYAATFANIKRHLNPLELKGGFKALDWNGFGVVPSRMQKTGRVDWVNLKTTKMWELSDWDILRRGGNEMEPDPQGRVASVITWFKYGEIASMQRNSGGAITGLAA